VAMLLITLTIVGMGTAFNWGRPTWQWPNQSAGRCWYPRTLGGKRIYTGVLAWVDWFRSWYTAGV
jgi:hypothetical protein